MGRKTLHEKKKWENACSFILSHVTPITKCETEPKRGQFWRLQTEHLPRVMSARRTYLGTPYLTLPINVLEMRLLLSTRLSHLL
jgi:hypothetical protein